MIKNYNDNQHAHKKLLWTEWYITEIYSVHMIMNNNEFVWATHFAIATIARQLNQYLIHRQLLMLNTYCIKNINGCVTD